MNEKRYIRYWWAVVAVAALTSLLSCTTPETVTYPLNDLMDVDLTGLDSGDILVKDGNRYIVVDGLWEIQYLPGGCYTIEDTTINGQTYLIGTK